MENNFPPCKMRKKRSLVFRLFAMVDLSLGKEERGKSSVSYFLTSELTPDSVCPHATRRK